MNAGAKLVAGDKFGRSSLTVVVSQVPVSGWSEQGVLALSVAGLGLFSHRSLDFPVCRFNYTYIRALECCSRCRIP